MPKLFSTSPEPPPESWKFQINRSDKQAVDTEKRRRMSMLGPTLSVPVLGRYASCSTSSGNVLDISRQCLGRFAWAKYDWPMS